MLQGRQLSDSRFQIDSLDGLRGLAILIVFGSHTSNGGMHLLPWMDFSGIGKYGVFLFFVLSSFLLTYPFLVKSREAFTRGFLINYFIRRFFRIYPLYFIFLLLKLLITKFVLNAAPISMSMDSPFTLTFQEFINHLLLLQGKGVTWSIMVEFRFYFLLPIIAFCFTILFRHKLILSGLFTLAMTVAAQLFWPESEMLRNDDRLGPYLPLFFMGAFLALCHYRWQSREWAKPRDVTAALEISGVLAMAAVIVLTPSIFTFLAGAHAHTENLHKRLLLFGLLWSLVLFASIHGAGYLRRLFSSWPLRQVGFISFSIYLLHPSLIGAAERFYHGSHRHILGWLLLVVTICLSYVSFYLIEKPLSRIRYRPS